MSKPLTTGQLAEREGVAVWQVRRAADACGVPIVRVGHYRALDEESIPAVIAEMERRGWLQPAEATA